MIVRNLFNIRYLWVTSGCANTERDADFPIPDRISKDGVDDAVHILWNFFDAKGTMMPRLIFAVVSSFSAPQA